MDVNEWVFHILNTKPDVLKGNDFVNKLYEKEKNNFKSRNALKVVLMSDLHLDFDYTPGMSNNCGKPLCCRSDSGLPKNEADKSG